jgi:hypothetical protein
MPCVTGELLGGVGTFIAAVGGVFAGVRYFIEKRDTKLHEARAERRRRHERILNDWAAFVSNPLLVPAIRILEYEEPELRQLDQKLSLHEYQRWKNSVDQILEFLLRLAFSVQSQELDAEPVREAVGWYFRKAVQNESLRQYCEKQGYLSVIELGREWQQVDPDIPATTSVPKSE